MQGAARALFVPLSAAVGLAMCCSYLISRTLVPILCCRILPGARTHSHPESSPEDGRYSRLTGRLLGLRSVVLGGYVAAALLVLSLLGSRLPQEIFPSSDEPQFQIRLRAPVGTRVERTEE